MPEQRRLEVTEGTLVALLDECLPYLLFMRGGADVEELIGKVKLVLELSGRILHE